MKLTADIRHYRKLGASDSHGYHQLLVAVSGSMELAMQGRENVITTSRGGIVPAECRHDFVVTGDNQSLVIDVGGDPQELAERGLPELDRLFDKASWFAADPALQQLARFAALELPRHPSDSAIAQQLAVTLLLAVQGRPLQDVDRSPLDLAVIDSYIDQHLHEPIRVADLARLVHRSPGHFQALFGQATGQSVLQYLRKRRAELAIRLIESTDRSLADIATATGFAHQSALTHTLRELTGITPGRLRRR
ncbi:helix-turn-helix transcriptional regulator [Permianibacter sp. IMCC34836]|uniref:helix-turn-helix domain-containing protein n=1 Tax=Permianibacter fluminis TaxID=2738515 RepID=UPI001552786B|nr:AraC family transcriptional regulator [Permianibacter fluminis]NQD38105.1 helix-turn-helix transcriptional regulator [Permianibacter fluminis]